jgi:eukaryotic-like serine/threonine-protein kinase
MSEPIKTPTKSETETIDVPLAQQATEDPQNHANHPPPQLVAGQWVSHYFVRRSLGVGGMGEVYLADDKILGRKVALKMLSRSLSSDQEMQARFMHEAKTLASLKHENIGGVHAITEIPQGRVLVLEYIEGPSMRDLLQKQGALTVKAALPLFLQLAQALKAAHSRQIVHRDLKPDNLKITPNDQLKVLDFGIALMLEKQQAALTQSRLNDVAGSKTLTQPEPLFSDEGIAIGTPDYMAPEQLLGGKQDQRVDVWGFGCVLFEALTQRCPFTRNSKRALYTAIYHEPPDWHWLPAATPDWLRELLRRCLEKDPAHRWQNMDEVAAQLAQGLPAPRKTRIIPVQHLVNYSKTPGWVIPALGALVIILTTLLVGKEFIRRANAPTQKYLAIVPFKPLGRIAQDPLLANGLLKLLRDNLNSIAGLQVIRESPPSPDSDNLWVASNLGAKLILRGSVERETDRVNINYLLLNDRAYKLKDETIENNDLVAAVDHMSEQVAQTLGLTYSAPQRLPAEQAFQLAYVQALGHLEKAQMLGGEAGGTEAGAAIELLGKILEQPAGKQAIYYAAQARAYLIKHDLTQDDFWLAQAKNACDLAQGLTPANELQRRQVQFTLAEINQELGRHEEATQNFQQVLQQNPASIAALVGLGNSYAALNRRSEAEATFRKAIALDRDFWISHNEYGAYAFEHGQYDEAARQWRDVVRLTPNQADGHSNLGIAYLYQNQLEAATAAFRQSLSILRTPEAHANLGTVLYYQGKFPEAAAEFKKGLELSPRSPTLLANAGDAARQLSNQTEEVALYDVALSRYEALAASASLSETEIAQQAEVLAKRGQLALALPQIAQVLQAAPNNTECLARAVIVYELAGQRAQALRWARQAVKEGYPKHFLARDPVLAALRADPQFATINGN